VCVVGAHQVVAGGLAAEYGLLDVAVGFGEGEVGSAREP
jgi:hypothetical protein